MKTTVYQIIAIGIILTVAAACNKATGERIPAPADIITVSASLPELTRVAAADRESGTGISWAWEEGDAINVIGSISSVLKIDEGFTAKKATFSGKPVSGDSFDIVFPGDYASVSALESISLADQTQKDVSSKSGLMYFAALQGLKSYSSFEFSPAWAGANGATLRQGGVLKIVTTLPSETVTVSRIAIKASAPIFHADNGEAMTDAISIAFEDGTLGDTKAVTAWLTTSWFDTAIPAGTTLQLTAGAGEFTWLSDISFDAEKTIKAGSVNILTIPVDSWYNTGRYSGGAGTAASPWIITKPEQMEFIRDDLAAGDIRCYKLGADIDMTGIDGWEPLNYESPYDKQVDFNGAGHVITGFHCDFNKYPGFFGVLNGTCHDVVFKNAKIECSTKTKSGILAGYAGSGDIHAEIYNVHVQGEVTNTGSDNGHGGLVGAAPNANISRCSAQVDVTTGKNYAGGLVGYVAGACTISDCWTSGSVNGNQRVGGITGGFTSTDITVRNCYSLSSVTANFCIAGIAAHCNQDKGDNPDTRTPNYTIEKCIAWNDGVVANKVSEGDKSHYSGGAIAGFISTHNTLTDCIRKADFNFVEYSDLFGLYDQENATPDVPLVTNAVEGATYNYPYHGKAAAAGATVSDVAKSLGWSADIWDFSGELPQLK